MTPNMVPIVTMSDGTSVRITRNAVDEADEQPDTERRDDADDIGQRRR